MTNTASGGCNVAVVSMTSQELQLQHHTTSSTHSLHGIDQNALCDISVCCKYHKALFLAIAADGKIPNQMLCISGNTRKSNGQHDASSTCCTRREACDGQPVDSPWRAHCMLWRMPSIPLPQHLTQPLQGLEFLQPPANSRFICNDGSHLFCGMLGTSTE